MGILNPAALPLLSLLGILILIYLRERWRTRIEVPSLLFWNVVTEDKTRVRKRAVEKSAAHHHEHSERH